MYAVTVAFKSLYRSEIRRGDERNKERRVSCTVCVTHTMFNRHSVHVVHSDAEEVGECALSLEEQSCTAATGVRDRDLLRPPAVQGGA